MPNPFGVQLAGDNQAEIARKLGAAWLRLTCFLKGDQRSTQKQCQAAVDAGLSIILTLRWTDSDRRPTKPPASAGDRQKYRSAVTEALKLPGVQIVAVENEHETDRYFVGGYSDYLAMLEAVADLAAGTNIQVVDGGLTSRSVILLTVQDLMDKGNDDDAVTVARALWPSVKSVRGVRSNMKRYVGDITTGQDLLGGYRGVGAAYCNHHWYHDPTALPYVLKYLRATSGLSTLCNEIGQFEESADDVRAKLTTAQTQGEAVIVWYSIDKSIGTKSLVGPDGAILPTGAVFQQVATGRSVVAQPTVA